jgi:hypothetical protein
MVIKIPVRCRFFCIACWLNPPFNIILRCRVFFTIGVVRGEGGGGCHWREQTKAHEFCLVPAYPPQAQHLVLGHSLNDVQIKVLQEHQVVVVVNINQVVFVIVVVIIIVIVVVVVVIAALLVLVAFIVIVPQQLCRRGIITRIEPWIKAQHLGRIGARIATWV